MLSARKSAHRWQPGNRTVTHCGAGTRLPGPEVIQQPTSGDSVALPAKILAESRPSTSCVGCRSMLITSINRLERDFYWPPFVLVRSRHLRKGHLDGTARFCAALRPDVVRRRTTKCTGATLIEGDVPFWYERNRRRDEPKPITIGVPLQNGDQKSPKFRDTKGHRHTVTAIPSLLFVPAYGCRPPKL
jgi:hypothetical protein